MAAKDSAGPQPPSIANRERAGQPGELGATVGELALRDEALRRAVRLDVVQELADDMAHDLNNVLTVIAGSLQLFLMQQGGETVQHHFVRNAIEAALRGAQMTGNLLAYASPQVIDTRVFDVAGLIQGLAPLLRESLGSSITLDLESAVAALQPPNPPQPAQPAHGHWVLADSRFVESALLAMCRSVAHSTTPNAGAVSSVAGAATGSLAGRMAGRMSVRTCFLAAADAQRRSGAVTHGRDFIQLSIAVAGSGLSAADIRQTLTPAFHGGLSDRAALDLSAAYASVRQCGGDIGVEPLATDPAATGFVVTVLLPAATAPAPRP
jgi:signal transduction histidine kinase